MSEKLATITSIVVFFRICEKRWRFQYNAGMTEKNEQMAEWGRKGGEARRKWSQERRSEAARNAINARWAKKRSELDTK